MESNKKMSNKLTLDETCVFSISKSSQDSYSTSDNSMCSMLPKVADSLRLQYQYIWNDLGAGSATPEKPMERV